MGKKSKNKKQSPKADKGINNTPSKAAAFLQFPSGERCGLTSVSLSISSNKEAPSIVREIVQNSLDAATTAERELAHVRFSLETISPSNIPGIKEYEKAVNAIATHYEKKGWPEQTKDVVDNLQKGLKQKTIPMLIVTDNGIGLNPKTMMAILSDGVPEHEGMHSTGSHGNGHFTTFNLSDMRYVLYGGISAQSGKIASGHAILASHQDGRNLCGKDGYYVTKISHDLDTPHTFSTNNEIPKLLLNQLGKIESEWGTGTALIIPDFNYFGEDEESPQNAANLILGAVAQNFFVAVQQGKLVISVKASEKEWTLNDRNIQDIMAKTADIPRSSGFPNYDTASRFSRLFADCEKKSNNTDIVEVDTEHGKFEFLYRVGNVNDTKIALCRNGMWITASIPMIQARNFLGNVPFEGLLLCDATKGGDLHDYIRKAEGNLHNSLSLKLIQDKGKEKILRAALKNAREFIQNLIEKQDLESMKFLEIDSDSIRLSAPKQEKVKQIKDPIEPPEPSEPIDHPVDPPIVPPKPPSPKSGKSLGLAFTAVQNNNKLRIRILSTELASDVELQLSVNGGGDVSCANAAAYNIHISIIGAECNGNPCLVENGVARLGQINKGETKDIRVTFAEPPITGDYRIDCRFIRRVQRTKAA